MAAISDQPSRALRVANRACLWTRSVRPAAGPRLWLHFYRRSLARDTLPFAAGHLHPRVGPALIKIERLSLLIGALTFKGTSLPVVCTKRPIPSERRGREQ